MADSAEDGVRDAYEAIQDAVPDGSTSAVCLRRRWYTGRAARTRHPADLFALADEAGGVDRLEAWFTAHWADQAVAKQEWDAYLSGQYVCLRAVTPANLQRKDFLTAAIGGAPEEQDAGSAEWLERLHALIDELDVLEPAFTAYDRLRFNGPVSRDICIDAMRARFPRVPSVTP